MTRQSYITIQEWMLELGLKGNELIAFALVWSFSRDNESTYNGSSKYLMRWLGINQRNTREVLKRLEDKGYIVKQDVYKGGVKYCSFSTPAEIAPLLKQPQTPAEIALQTPAETAPSNVVLRTTYSDSNNTGNNTREDNIYLPFKSKRFEDAWHTLLQEPEWRKKSRNAKTLTLKSLSHETEDVAIAMIEQTIRNGWKGIYPLKDKQYGRNNDASTDDRIHLGEKQYGEDTI